MTVQAPRQRCAIGGCGRWEEAGGLCPGHRRRKRLGLPLEAPLRLAGPTPWQLLEKAVEDYWECDVDDDEAFDRARQRLAYACRKYAASLPPLRRNLTYAEKKARGYHRRR